jgi:T5SS/PEP-CTERM-associated repeat protein
MQTKILYRSIVATLLAIAPLTNARAQLVSDSTTASIDGTSTNITGSLTVGSAGSFTTLIITNSGTVTNTSTGTIGNSATSKTNQVTVTDANSVWFNSGVLIVGSQGSYNVLLVTNGGKVLNSFGNIGSSTSGSNNQVIVVGTNSLWRSSSTLNAGNASQRNELHVKGGGTAEANFGQLGNGVGGSNNIAIITGAGSRWTNLTDLNVGVSGSFNTLIVTNGGALLDVNGNIGVDASGSNNVVLVTGANSLWTNRGELVVGSSGSNNRLVVTNGAKVFNNTGTVGLSTSSSNNVVTVTGTGSVWTNQSVIRIGQSGSSNQLSVADGGLVFGIQMFLGLNPGSSNNLVTVNGGYLVVTNSIHASSVNIRDGALMLNSGMVDIDILIATNGAKSQLTINGGTLQTYGITHANGSPLILGNGATPATLELLGAGTHTVTNGLQIANTALLKGNGTIIGNVTNASGGTVSPGVAIGNLTIGGSLALSSGSTNIFELNKTLGTNDNITGLAAVTYGGKLQLSNLSGSLASGDSFKLFDAGSYSGSFSEIIPSSPGGNLVWDTNGLATNGTLRVALTNGCLTPCNLYIFDGPSDFEVKIAWSPPVIPVKEYIIYRNGFRAESIEDQYLGSLKLFDDATLFPNRVYTYQVQALFTNGTLSALSDALSITSAPLNVIQGTNVVVNLMLRFADFVEEPFQASYVNGIMFTNQYSLSNYYREASYGKYSLKGTTHGWFTLPNYASNYCTLFLPGNPQGYGCAINQIVNDTFSVISPSVSNEVAAADIVQFIIHGMGTVGLSGGKYKFYSATNGFGPGTVIHEISHGLNTLRHAGSWELCSGYSVGPDFANLTNGGCFAFRYGDRYDPLGAGGTYHHNTFFKERLGWITQTNVQWIDHDGDYIIAALERVTNAVQMLKFDLGDEQFYFLEYRTATGFDGPNTPDPFGGAINGVLVRLRLATYAAGDDETLILYPRNYLASNFYFGQGAVFVDPYRNLRIEVVSTNSTTATVRVNGIANPFRINQLKQLGASKQDIELTFNSVWNAKYIAQASTNLTTWLTVKTNILTVTNSTTTVITNSGSPTGRYFRLGVDNSP